MTNSKLENLKADIRQGKEPEVLSLKYNTNVAYVKKVTSDMRQKDGEKLIDRRTKEWQLSQFMTGKDVERILGR